MAMRRKLIGVTTYGRDEVGSFSLPAVYVDAVQRAGGVGVLLPPVVDYEEEDLGQLDGLILTGGGDLDPKHYQENGHPTVYMVDAERDVCELALARRAVEMELPTLCICRGLQVLNVALGGTLVPHLPDVVGQRIAHRVPPRRPSWHEIRVRPGSRLAQVLGAERALPASWHHQAVDRVAPGLEAVAHASDGTIEALEMPDHPWLLAVQWHPELTAMHDPAQQALFDTLVEMAATEEGVR